MSVGLSDILSPLTCKKVITVLDWRGSKCKYWSIEARRIEWIGTWFLNTYPLTSAHFVTDEWIVLKLLRLPLVLHPVLQRELSEESSISTFPASLAYSIILFAASLLELAAETDRAKSIFGDVEKEIKSIKVTSNFAWVSSAVATSSVRHTALQSCTRYFSKPNMISTKSFFAAFVAFVGAQVVSGAAVRSIRICVLACRTVAYSLRFIDIL